MYYPVCFLSCHSQEITNVTSRQMMHNVSYVLLCTEVKYEGYFVIQ